LIRAYSRPFLDAGCRYRRPPAIAVTTLLAESPLPRMPILQRAAIPAISLLHVRLRGGIGAS
jgi:hypothetical protein